MIRRLFWYAVYLPPWSTCSFSWSRHFEWRWLIFFIVNWFKVEFPEKSKWKKKKGRRDMIYHTSVSQINWKKNPHAVLHETDSMGACAADKTKLWFMSVYETAPKSLFLFRTCVPGFEYAPWLAGLKKPLSICQSRWKEIRNVLPVIRWVRWRPSTRISALRGRRY